MNNRSENRKGSFNLDKFYEDLQRVQSSLGKGEYRRSTNSPLVKQTKHSQQPEHRIQNNLASFKKELNTRKLIKTRINLDTPYERSKANRTQNKDSANQSKNYRFSEASNEVEEEVDPYQQVRSKLMSWKRQDSHEEVKDNKKMEIKKFYKSKYSSFDKNQAENIKNSFEYLQKTMETPSNQMFHQQQIKQSRPTKLLNQALFSELNKRNKIYKQVERGVGSQKSYYKRRDQLDLSIKFQLNMREHQLMLKVVQQFKRICGLQVNELTSLHSFLKEGNKQEQSVSKALESEQDEIILG